MISPSYIREYKKSTGVVIMNDEGKMALQLRAAHDDSYPLYWNFAAGGGIDEGEDEQFAAKREALEELGINVEVIFITQKLYVYPSWKPDVIRDAEVWLYLAHHNGPFTPDPNEVEKVAFFSLEEIQNMLKTGEKFHPAFVCAWEDGSILNI